jgi:hypothetical protein
VNRTTITETNEVEKGGTRPAQPRSKGREAPLERQREAGRRRTSSGAKSRGASRAFIRQSRNSKRRNIIRISNI